MASARSLRKLAKSMQARTDARPAHGIVDGTVTTVTAGGASDGRALAEVTLDSGTVQQMGYLASYTPTVGDRVRVLIADRYPLILGKPIGLPSY